MKKGNRISEVFSEADVKDVLAAVAVIQQKMPWLITLSPDESRGLRNLGFDGVAFAQAGLEAVRANIDFTRRGFDLAEYEKDLALLEQLSRVRGPLVALTQAVVQTHQLTGADVMVAADDIYEDLTKDDGETAAVQAPRKQMSKRYAHRTTKPDTTTVPKP
jgi:hypothetical protein